ncbi:hypothetical protein [Bradyrhizobium barranii]|uniref:hypothetical protein n=1 Tax=Bradyrhizobium barranii TaxID=2992140 RepID=UPI003D16020A
MQSLALAVRESLKRDPHAGDLYIFRGRRGDRAGSVPKCGEMLASACSSKITGLSKRAIESFLVLHIGTHSIIARLGGGCRL